MLGLSCGFRVDIAVLSRTCIERRDLHPRPQESAISDPPWPSEVT